MTDRGDTGESIILCQPDSKKGCSACCGLLNLADISKKKLTRFLNSFDQRRNVSGRNNCFWNLKTEYREIRSDMAHICPYQGFIFKGKPGCMHHPEVSGKCLRKKSLFGARICSDYLCPAHEILNDEQKRILVRCLNDWRLYMIAIADPDSFIWITDILKKYINKNPADMKPAEAKVYKRALHSALSCHAEFMHSIKCTVFYYSEPEYNIGKATYSLGSRSKKMRPHRVQIRGRIKSFFQQV